MPDNAFNPLPHTRKPPHKRNDANYTKPVTKLARLLLLLSRIHIEGRKRKHGSDDEEADHDAGGRAFRYGSAGGGSRGT
jgi:hypothetical protein